MDSGVDCLCFFEASGPVFLNFAALETGLKFDGFSGGNCIHSNWGGGGDAHGILVPESIINSDSRPATSSFRTDDC